MALPLNAIKAMARVACSNNHRLSDEMPAARTPATQNVNRTITEILSFVNSAKAISLAFDADETDDVVRAT